MVFRIYVEKRTGFDGEAKSLQHELVTLLGITSLTGLRLVNRYDVEGIDRELFESCVPTVFSEPQTDVAAQDAPALMGAGAVFAVEYLPGQFDQRADSASECIQLISQGERPAVRSAKMYLLEGDLTADDVAAVKHYVINPVEAREASLAEKQTLKTDYATPQPVAVLQGFCSLDDAGLQEMIADLGLAMDLADIRFCQQYFTGEKRDPTLTEIRVLDTYWSDHCRHTTFGTIIDDVKIDDAAVQKAFERYVAMRAETNRTKPICLMDAGTMGARYLKSKGILKNLDESDEINACTVKIKCDVNGHEEDWLYLFKNETHNHPTEIEPFGGAATCVGGAIRDPLSGRSYVYQAMRVTGAADPLLPVSETLPGKLPQRKLVVDAAHGYSSYGNQIGLATGQVNELYHPGYVAKRMEIGAVVGATPANHVRREEPAPGDAIVLLGGRTGRDGIGGATGSSKSHNVKSLELDGAEVQKGNAPVERKLQRLFRREDACRMIKRCNDFGAGGVSVACGELADGLSINLDKVPKKYEGLDGTELSISESQERMAVALAAEDVDAFIGLATEENLEATVIAQVTAEPRLKMAWRGDTIVDISREFIDSNGAPKHMNVEVEPQGAYSRTWEGATLAERFKSLVSDLNVCSNKGLSERFDSTIGAGTVLMPFGGKYQLTPSMAMAAKLPVFGETTTCSGMAWGFNPYLSSANQYEGAYVAVVESVSRLIAAGFEMKNAYLTFQEYFEKLGSDPKRWGKPFAALMGALAAQVDLGVGAIGGKDSMSGSFEKLDVPPTLVSFATATGQVSRVTSPEFKHVGSRVIYIRPTYGADGMIPQRESLLGALARVQELIGSGAAASVATPGYGCLAECLFKMCVGNGIGLEVDTGFAHDLFEPAYGSFVVELADGAEGDAILGAAAAMTAEANAAVADAAAARAAGGVADAATTGASAVVRESGAYAIEDLGTTTQAYQLMIADQMIDLHELQEVWEARMEPVMPYRVCENAAESSVVDDKGATAVADSAAVETITSDAAPTLLGAARVARPRVVIPVFPGNNCEYDSAAAFERAGAEPSVLVVNNLSPEAVADSIHDLCDQISKSQIIMIPGGFSGGDEPDGSAKFITAFFRNPAVTEAVRDLLQNRDGLMLGICNGFQALVKLGLVPYGDIVPMTAECPTLTFNTIGRHQSRLVRTRVCSNLSPWMSECPAGSVYTVPISHGEGRFVANDSVLASMCEHGQIATQYVGLDGKPSMNLDCNPNGSVLSIEGITSPDGRVFGKMGHSERSGSGLYKNVPGNSDQPIFRGGVKYFTD